MRIIKSSCIIIIFNQVKKRRNFLKGSIFVKNLTINNYSKCYVLRFFLFYIKGCFFEHYIGFFFNPFQVSN